MITKTLREEFDNFIATCYKTNPLPSDQYLQLHRAFFAGALQTFNYMMAATELPEDKCEGELSRITKEIHDECRHITSIARGRN